MNKVFHALSDPTRRRVLQLLRSGPMLAGAISDQFDVSKPTMSAHLAVLREADLVEAERHGRTIVYRLKLSVLEDAVLSFAQAVGMRVAAPGGSRSRDRRGGAVRKPIRGAT